METYFIKTFGCQMNKHDSERVAGMLTSSGMSATDTPDDADVVVFMTCCVRENADERLHGQVASLKASKMVRPTQLIAVGGCIGQRDGGEVLRALPHVDVVFGTHNLGNLPSLLAHAQSLRAPVVEILEEGTEFSSDLPARRVHPWHAWVPITVGCDNHCSYCIVPRVRGRERSRPIAEVISECERLIADGVLEITLLGQNVNSYGRDLFGEPRFAVLLAEVAKTGIGRIRFATSHPKDLSPETIETMATSPAVAHALHLPVQSGSDRVLELMNRRYTADYYLGLVEKLYEAIPDLALSTDIIVGFPTETENDFEDTLHVVRKARFDQAFTFIYSAREGTPAATLQGQVPREVSQARFDRLVELVHETASEKNARLVGSVQSVLVEGPSKRDDAVLAGRNSGNKVVHMPVPPGKTCDEFAGRFADVRIEKASTWFLSGHIEG